MTRRRNTRGRGTRRVAGAVTAVLVLAGVLTVATPDGPAGAASGFRCGTLRGGSGTAITHITDVRTGRHATYDRFVIQFSSSHVPPWTIVPKSSTVFWLDPSDRRVTLLGRAGLKIVLQHATGIGTYRGPTDFRPGFPQLREARRIGDFEAVTTWGLGLRVASCKRVITLQHPTRLVVDVPH